MIPYRSPIDAGSTAIDRLVAVRSVRLRARRGVHAAPVVAAAAIACGGVFAWMGGGLPSLAWALLVLAATLLNRRECSRLAAMPDDAPPERVAVAEGRLWWLTVGKSLAVGSGIWFNDLEAEDPRVQYLVTMVVALYCVGALVNAATHPPTFLTGVWINLGSLFAYWMLQGIDGWAPAAATCGLMVLLTRFSTQIRLDFERLVRTDRDNVELLARLREETAVAREARLAAEQANRTKSRFLAAASHDLRQPLHTLLLFASLLERADPTHRPQFVQHIQAAAGALDKLFAGLLDLSRLDAGAVSAAPRTVATRDLIAPVVEEFAGAAAVKGLALLTRIDDAAVRTDPFLFERVLRNLVDNAIKYTDRGEVEVSAQADGEVVRIRVRDTGVGIAEADHGRVFDEFEQLRRASRGVEQGAGLGLAIARRMCELLGHGIELSSAPGAGSTFTLTLPREALSGPARTQR